MKVVEVVALFKIAEKKIGKNDGDDVAFVWRGERYRATRDDRRLEISSAVDGSVKATRWY